MHTLVITKHDVTKLIDIEALKTELTEGFKKYSGGADGRIGQRIILDLGSGNKTTVLGPGVSEGIPAYTVKPKFVIRTS